jgi:DNA-binding transcriptional regulator YdaS (Cro superfamily)
MSNPDVIKKACYIAGNQAELARRVGVTPQMVTKWLSGKPVSAERAIAIERATGGQVSRTEIRPDLWEDAAA